MTPDDLSRLYRGYIDCLNRQDWSRLGNFVDDEVAYNDEPIGLSGYRRMLESDFRAIPDLRFNVTLLVTEPPRIASRLHFDCTPVGDLFELPAGGKRVQFDENVFYEFAGEKIRWVWSVIDKAAVAARL
ncbi:putative ester cyclase [Amorphus suaedae]